MDAMLLVACGSQEAETPPAAAVTPATVETGSDVADVVYLKGEVYTANEAEPWAEAVAIKDGSFAA
jgi:hypothetical protein